MGLTIHFVFRLPEGTREQVRAIIEKLRTVTLKTFPEVTEIVAPKDLEHPASDHEAAIAFGAAYYREVDERWIEAEPVELIGFSAVPGEGSEYLRIGLARYPTHFPQKPDTPTGITGWYWQSFCKTQYASNPTAGGIANFIRCHAGIVHILDAARELGILDQVVDESGYWDHRDQKRLAEEVTRWNQLTAAFAGTMKDQLGDVKAAITDFPDFEHLEAQGLDRIREAGGEPDDEA